MDITGLRLYLLSGSDALHFVHSSSAAISRPFFLPGILRRTKDYLRIARVSVYLLTFWGMAFSVLSDAYGPTNKTLSFFFLARSFVLFFLLLFRAVFSLEICNLLKLACFVTIIILRRERLPTTPPWV